MPIIQFCFSQFFHFFKRSKVFLFLFCAFVAAPRHEWGFASKNENKTNKHKKSENKINEKN